MLTEVASIGTNPLELGMLGSGYVVQARHLTLLVCQEHRDLLTADMTLPQPVPSA